MKKLCNEAQPL